MRRFASVVALLSLTLLAAPASARATVAGAGRIFFSTGAVLPDPDPEANSQVFSVQPDGTDVRQLTHLAAPAQAGDPAVSPDGKQVLYVANRHGPYQVWLMSASGRGAHRLIVDPDFDAFVPQWSPDGQQLLFTRCTTQFGVLECTIAIANIDGTGLRDLTHGRWAELAAAWSPDGATVAFSSNRGGLQQAIWTVPASGGSPHRLTGADREAFWPDYRPDGQQILFGDNFDRPNTNVWVMQPDGTHPRQLTHITSPIDIAFARYAPDGSHLVADFYNGRTDWLVTMNTDGTGLRKLVNLGPNGLTLADWGASS